MPQRTIELDGQRWTVSMTGRRTQYAKDEFSVLFTRVGSDPAEQRVARYSPQGSKAREDSLAELSDRRLAELLDRSQPAWTTPETGYRH
jgi:hypothetical protein